MRRWPIESQNEIFYLLQRLRKSSDQLIDVDDSIGQYRTISAINQIFAENFSKLSISSNPEECAQFLSILGEAYRKVGSLFLGEENRSEIKSRYQKSAIQFLINWEPNRIKNQILLIPDPELTEPLIQRERRYSNIFKHLRIWDWYPMTYMLIPSLLSSAEAAKNELTNLALTEPQSDLMLIYGHWSQVLEQLRREFKRI